MVSYTVIKSSNARIASALPSGLVAVFVGATNGIGETTLREFARYTRQPRVYFVGRSQEAGTRIAGECEALNPEGKFTFIKADISLMRVVDDVCRDIKSKEKAINVLFLSQGTMITGVGMLMLASEQYPNPQTLNADTAEGLNLAGALPIYSRNRFAVNLLPLLQRATGLRRVVSCFTATKEGPVFSDDWQVRSLHKGFVKSGNTRGTTGGAMMALKAVSAILGPFLYMNLRECGERHLFLCTSARYPAGEAANAADGVPLADGLVVARGTDGKDGSGCYSVDAQGESAGLAVEETLAKFRKEGLVEKIWENTEEEFVRITGTAVGD
ncbi:hypothetical protein H2203_008416 [Taxawa tesnikishii (nom. ined.)]|nr:hypothetical protein H2203_008416 [Dothideales sp. JES 119]